MRIELPVYHYTSERGVPYPTAPVDVQCYFQGVPNCEHCGERLDPQHAAKHGRGVCVPVWK